MPIYSILFSDDKFIYIEMYDELDRINVAVPISEFDKWREGKIEK